MQDKITNLYFVHCYNQILNSFSHLLVHSKSTNKKIRKKAVASYCACMVWDLAVYIDADTYDTKVNSVANQSGNTSTPCMHQY